MKYMVVKVEGTEFTSDASLKELSEEVELHCQKGWKPQGGVSITSISDYDLIFAQALIKEDEDEKPKRRNIEADLLL